MPVPEPRVGFSLSRTLGALFSSKRQKTSKSVKPVAAYVCSEQSPERSPSCARMLARTRVSARKKFSEIFGNSVASSGTNPEHASGDFAICTLQFSLCNSERSLRALCTSAVNSLMRARMRAHAQAHPCVRMQEETRNFAKFRPLARHNPAEALSLPIQTPSPATAAHESGQFA